MASGGKRGREAGPAEQYGGRKRRSQQAGDPRELDQPTLDDTTYRILCPESQVGNILGKGGSTVKLLRRETGGKIRVIDIEPGVRERIVLIWSSQKGRDGRDDEYEGTKAFDDKEFVCPAQAALFKVHSRITEGAAADHVSITFLVPNIQIGCLLGKGGKIIQRMRSETSAQIRTVPKHEVPRYIVPSDELVEISGNESAVQKAMYEISTRIHKSPLSDRSLGPVMPPEPFGPVAPRSAGRLHPLRDSLVGSGSVGRELIGPDLGYRSYRGLDSELAWPRASSTVRALSPAPLMDSMTATKNEEFFVRILCSKDKVGFIIGRKGIAVRQLEESTGARIKVEDTSSDCNERVIVVSAMEYLNDRSSPVIDAALQLQSGIGYVSRDIDGTFKTSLLVPEKQVGGLLGRKGSVIGELRKRTGANINVTRKGLPICAQETDELVEIIGDKETSRIALVEILKRLRRKAFNVEVEDGRYRSGGEPLPSYLHESILNGYPLSSVNTDDRHELGSQRYDLGSQRHELGSQRYELGSQRYELGSQRYELGSQRYELGSQRYELGSPGRMDSLNDLGGGHALGNLGGGTRYSASYGGTGSYQGFGAAYDDAPLSHGGTLDPSAGRRPSNSTSVNFSKNLREAPVDLTYTSETVNAILGSRMANLSRVSEASGAEANFRDPVDQAVEISGDLGKSQPSGSLYSSLLYRGLSHAGGHRGLY